MAACGETVEEGRTEAVGRFVAINEDTVRVLEAGRKGGSYEKIVSVCGG